MSTQKLVDYASHGNQPDSTVAMKGATRIDSKELFDIGESLISVEQAAALLCVTVGSIYKWIKLRKLPAYRLARKAIRLRMDEVRRFTLMSRTI